MNNNTTAVDREKVETTFNTTSEYKIGHTTYTVTTVFNPASKESLSDILKRMIIRECDKSSVNPDKNPRSRLCNFGIMAHCIYFRCAL